MILSGLAHQITDWKFALVSLENLRNRGVGQPAAADHGGVCLVTGRCSGTWIQVGYAVVTAAAPSECLAEWGTVGVESEIQMVPREKMSALK